MQYSPSKIKKQLTCQGLESAPNPNMERGTILHDMLSGAEYSRTGSSYRGKVKKYEFDHDFEELEALALDIKAQYPDIIAEYEAEIEVNTIINSPLNGEYQLSGIIDRFLVSDQQAHIVDWKSGRTRIDTKNIVDSLQAIVYSYLIFCMYPQVKDIVFEYIYIDADYSEEVRFNVAEKPVLRQIIDSLVTSTSFVGFNVGEHCKYCQRADKCPLVDSYLQQTMYKEIELETLKLYKKVITQALDLRKETLKQTSDGLLSMRKINYNYVSKSNLQAEDLLDLLPDEVKINKLKADELKKKGIETYTKTSYSL